MLQETSASKEQAAYASVLFYGCWVGLTIMLITYAIYLTGFVASHVPLEQVPRYWGDPVEYYLTAAHVPTGWGWVSLLKTGDFMNFIGIVLLASMSIICYLRIIPLLLREKNMLMVSVAILEIIVLLLAASGILGTGGH